MRKAGGGRGHPNYWRQEKRGCLGLGLEGRLKSVVFNPERLLSIGVGCLVLWEACNESKVTSLVS